MSLYGIHTGQEIAQEGMEIFKAGGLTRGDSTGWRAVDNLYTVSPKQWTLITGTPGSGKSEWLDALLLNLVEQNNWHFAFYSPENYPVAMHLTKLIEKHVRKPARRGPTPMMSLDEYEDAAEFLTTKFFWLDPKAKDHLTLIDTALKFREPAVGGKKFGIILDPWNTLESLRPSKWTETEYISAALNDVTQTCREQDCHIFVVAHPKMMMRDKDGERAIPTPYDISGSAHWYNKGDNIICVNRDQVEGGSNVDIYVQKIRHKHMGKVGMASLSYDYATGRYRETGPEIISRVLVDL